MKKIIYSIAILFLLSCNQKENTLEFEKKVMDEIFIDLVDTFYQEITPIPPPPPPLPEIYFQTNDQRIKDSLLAIAELEHQKAISAVEKYKKEIFEENKPIVIAVSDTLHSLGREYQKLLEEHFKKSTIKNILTIDSLKYKINLNSFRNSKKFIFKYRSEFPENSKLWNWRQKNYSELGAIISFSRITFDKTKNYGILTGGIAYGRLDGNGGIIYLKKEAGKWIIDNVIETWIS